MSDILTKIKRIVLILGDIGVLYLSLYITLLIRYQGAEIKERFAQHFLPFSFIFLIWLIIFYISGIYSLQIARTNMIFYSVLLKSLAWCAALSMAFFYILRPGITPKTNLLIEFAVLIILFLAWRQIFNILVKIKPWQNNVLIIGLNEETLKLAQEINSNPQLGLKVTGIINEGETKIDVNKILDLEILNPPHSLPGLVKIKKVKTIITALNPHHNPELVNKLYECIPLKIYFFDLPTFIEKFTGKIPVNSIGQIWFLENLKESQKVIYEICKRAIDICLSLLFLIFAIPLLPILYLIVKLDSQGSFLFMQMRTGRLGKKFLAIKIRTMYQNSESSGPQWAAKNDPRVTRSGKIMRKIRIDEIPQLINILRGEMSFIGPRPERPEFIEKLENKIPYYNERLLVKPGLTGWAQVNFPYGSSEADALEKLQYDLYYIKNRSAMLDTSILLKTIKTVLSGVGQ